MSVYFEILDECENQVLTKLPICSDREGNTLWYLAMGGRELTAWFPDNYYLVGKEAFASAALEGGLE